MKKVKKKSRTGSEASSFDQKTIQEFKEAFGVMDQDKDGVISKQDLKDLYATLGSIASESQIDAMLKEAPGPINFTVFLTLFGERLTGELGKVFGHRIAGYTFQALIPSRPSLAHSKCGIRRT